MAHKDDAEAILKEGTGPGHPNALNSRLDGIIHAILSLGESAVLEDEQIDIIRIQARREAAHELRALSKDTKTGAGEQIRELYKWIDANE